MITRKVPEENASIPRGANSLALALALLALLVRVIYLLESAASPFRHHLYLDPRVYDLWARQIAGGHLFGSDAFPQAPLYPYFLAILYTLLGTSAVRALWVQAILGAATAFLGARVAGRHWGKAGLIATGLLLALYKPGLFYSGVLLAPTLGAFLLALALFLIPRRPLAAGICSGLAGLTHPLLLVGALTSLVGLLWQAHPGRFARRPILLGLAGVVLAIAPVSVHNLVAGGRLVPIATSSGVNFYIGNGPAATGFYAMPPGSQREEDLLGLREASRLAQRPLSSAEASQFWTTQALAALRESPGHAVGLYLRKLYLFFHAYEAPQIESLDFEQRYSALLRFPLLPGWILLVALTGTALYLRPRDRVLHVMLAAVVLTALATAVFFVTGRFRFPVHVYLAVGAGAGCASLLETFPGQRGRLLRALGLMIVIVFALAPNWLKIDRGRTLANSYCELAGFAEAEGRPEEARRAYAEALQRDPQSARALINLGVLTARAGDLTHAEPLLERGTALSPLSARGYLALGQIRQIHGDLAAACSLYARAWSVDATFTRGLESLATARYLRGETAAAESLAVLLLQREGASGPLAARCGFLVERLRERRRFGWPLWTTPARAEGDLALAVRDLAKAEEAYRRAVAIVPGDLAALLELARVAAARGDSAGRSVWVSRFLTAGGPPEAVGTMQP